MDLFTIWRTADVEQDEQKKVTQVQRLNWQQIDAFKLRRQVLSLFDTDDQLTGVTPLTMTVARGGAAGPSFCVYTVVSQDCAVPCAATAIQQMFEQVDRQYMRGTLIALVLTIDGRDESTVGSATIRDALRRRVLPDVDFVLELSGKLQSQRMCNFALAELERPLARRLALLTLTSSVVDARHAHALVHSEASLALATFEDVRARRIVANIDKNDTSNNDNGDGETSTSSTTTTTTTPSSSTTSSSRNTKAAPQAAAEQRLGNEPIVLTALPERSEKSQMDMPLAIYASFNSLQAHEAALKAIGNMLSFLYMVPFALRRLPDQAPFRLSSLCRVSLGGRGTSSLLDNRNALTRGPTLDDALFSDPDALALRTGAAFTPLAALGAVVKTKQTVAVLVDAYGTPLVHMRAPRESLLFGTVTSYRVRPNNNNRKQSDLIYLTW